MQLIAQVTQRLKGNILKSVKVRGLSFWRSQGFVGNPGAILSKAREVAVILGREPIALVEYVGFGHVLGRRGMDRDICKQLVVDFLGFLRRHAKPVYGLVRGGGAAGD